MEKQYAFRKKGTKIKKIDKKGELETGLNFSRNGHKHIFYAFFMLKYMF